MEKIKSIKDIEFVIRRAVWVDKRLPKPGPTPYQSPIGKWTSPEEVMMSLDDQYAESKIEKVLSQDVDDWWLVMNEWLPLITDMEDRSIVLKRCGNMGWKSIAYCHHMNRNTAKRRFDKALNEILKQLTGILNYAR